MRLGEGLSGGGACVGAGLRLGAWLHLGEGLSGAGLRGGGVDYRVGGAECGGGVRLAE